MTSKLAMLALVTDAFGGRGGIAQYNRDFFSALAGKAEPRGVVVSSITVVPRHAPDQVITPTSIHQTPSRPGRVPYALAALGIAFTRKVDLVFCGHLYLAPLAALIARLKRAKLVIQTHGIEAWSPPSKLQRAALEEANLVLCVSRYTRARVLDWAAIAPERVVVLPNTVGDGFKPGGGSELRSALELEGKKVILSVGRIDSRERYKGHDRVIKLVPPLVAEGHDVVYLIIGEGDDAGRLAKMAVEAGVADRVRFMGSVGSETLVSAYATADLFVMPSTGEGFGIVFLEAMASGTPAVGLPVAGARDALADSQLGIAASEAELLGSVARLLAGPKPDPNTLSQAVRDRFGRHSFLTCARHAIERLQEVA
jgi:phosphatidylinositol alpha-1,6-mannosyltransferase